MDLVVPKMLGAKDSKAVLSLECPDENFCFRLLFCCQEVVRARQKAVTDNLHSRYRMYHLGPAPKSGARPI